MLIIACGKVNKTDLLFTLSNDIIVVKRGSKTFAYSYQDINKMGSFLDSITHIFEDSVKAGQRKSVYKNISVTIVENMTSSQFITTLNFINNHCYKVVSEVNILGKELNIIKDMNSAIYPLWKRSDSLNVEHENKRDMSEKKYTGKVRLFSGDTAGLNTILECIVKHTEIDSCTYQICNDNNCLGMNDVYRNEIQINDLLSD